MSRRNAREVALVVAALLALPLAPTQAGTTPSYTAISAGWFHT
jgi:hypothetical protein